MIFGRTNRDNTKTMSAIQHPRGGGWVGRAVESTVKLKMLSLEMEGVDSKTEDAILRDGGDMERVKRSAKDEKTRF